MTSEERAVSEQPQASGGNTGMWIAIGCLALAAVAAVAVIGIAIVIYVVSARPQPPEADPGTEPVTATASLPDVAPAEPTFGPAPAPRQTGLAAADVALVNALVTDKAARKPYMRLDLGGGRTVEGVDLIELGQVRPLPCDLYVWLLIRRRQATGKLPPPLQADAGAVTVLERFGPRDARAWKRRAIQRFWGDYAAATPAPAALAGERHAPYYFVRYLEIKSYEREASKRRSRSGGMETWDKAVAAWRARGPDADAVFLADWEPDAAVEKIAETVGTGR